MSNHGNRSNPEVRQNEPQSRFETDQGGEISVLEYSKRPNRIIFLHTEVPDSLQGQGIASQLVKAALEYAREHRLRVIPQCPFVAEYLQKHPEYSDLAE